MFAVGFLDGFAAKAGLSASIARAFRAFSSSISVHDLYYQLATHTTGSHAGIYNYACYGNVYRNTLKEFLLPLGNGR